MKLTIVAEASTTWENGKCKSLVSEKFEAIIEANRLRGYKLQSWQFQQSCNNDAMVETIIGVFVLEVPTAKL